MKDLPKDWYETSMQPIREEAKTWPDWMQKGVDEARDHWEHRMKKYAEPHGSDGDLAT